MEPCLFTHNTRTSSSRYENLRNLRTGYNELMAACEAIMRPDGHYAECPCTGDGNVWGQGHKHMPNNPTVAICKQLRAAIAAAKGVSNGKVSHCNSEG